MSIMKRRLQIIEKYQPTELLKYAGLVVWFSTCIVVALAPVSLDEQLPDLNVGALWIAEIIFGSLYWHEVQRLKTPARPGMPSIGLVVMVICAVFTTYISRGGGLGGILLMVVASLLPWLLSLTMGLAWVVLQSIGLGIVISQHPNLDMLDTFTATGIFLGLALFAYIASLVAMRHASARDELRKVNSELRATQALLAENTRIAERVRIARELHDLVGHHLTALSLNLEVAAHLCEGKANEHVQQAKTIAKLLLSDVREVVSELRTSDHVDLAEALNTLIEGVPKPEIRLKLPVQLAAVDPRQAQVLLRCAQEIITNTVRHADASHLWLQLEQTNEGLILSARDDGRGAEQAQAGNGLKGMAERLKQLGGSLDIKTKAGDGFAITAILPLEART